MSGFLDNVVFVDEFLIGSIEVFFGLKGMIVCCISSIVSSSEFRFEDEDLTSKYP